MLLRTVMVAAAAAKFTTFACMLTLSMRFCIHKCHLSIAGSTHTCKGEKLHRSETLADAKAKQRCCKSVRTAVLDVAIANL